MPKLISTVPAIAPIPADSTSAMPAGKITTRFFLSGSENTAIPAIAR